MKKIFPFFLLFSSFVHAQWLRLPSSESSGINQIILHDSAFFAATTGGVYTSANGSVWQPAMNGLNHWWVKMIFSDGNSLYAGTERNTAYISNDGGVTWNLFFTNNNNAGRISGFAVIGNSKFVSVDGNFVWRTDDNGASWIQSDNNNGLLTSNVISLHTYQNAILSFTTMGIF
jgi:photosystem II stability/assembly factor-like uncharacterized protein